MATLAIQGTETCSRVYKIIPSRVTQTQPRLLVVTLSYPVHILVAGEPPCGDGGGVSGQPHLARHGHAEGGGGAGLGGGGGEVAARVAEARHSVAAVARDPRH